MVKKLTFGRYSNGNIYYIEFIIWFNVSSINHKFTTIIKVNTIETIICNFYQILTDIRRYPNDNLFFKILMITLTLHIVFISSFIGL
jgi:hypothetical protein